MKISFIAIISSLMLLLLVIPTACAKPSGFEVTDLNVSPAEVDKGQPAIVTIDVRNTGVSQDTYHTALVIDGVETETKDVTLAPGDKETITFTVIPDELGICHIELCGLTETLQVIETPQFELVNLSVTGEVLPGEVATITADVTNTGNIEGDYTASLFVDETEIDSETVTLAPGATETLSFSVIEENPGSYAIEVNELAATLEVLKPADFRVGYIVINPNPVVVGEGATVTVTIRE